MFTHGRGCRLYDSQGREVSRFSGRYRRQCAGLLASATRARDSPRSGPRHAHLEPVSQSLSSAARGKAGGVVRPGSRFLQQQRIGGDGGSAEAGAGICARKSRGGAPAKTRNPGAGKFVSRPHIWRALDHPSHEISRAVRAAGPGRGIRALQRRCATSKRNSTKRSAPW